MNALILYDNFKENPRLTAGWGFSLLVKDNLLFDTGEDGPALLKNMRELGVDPKNLEALVLSHDHWDHTGGLSHILRERRGIPVWCPPGFSAATKQKVIDFGGKLKETPDALEILPGIYISREFKGQHKTEVIYEQCILAHGDEGVSLFAGCAHPGISVMAEGTRDVLPEVSRHLCLGGFHLMNTGAEEISDIFTKIRGAGYRKIGATHCSGNTARELSDLQLGVGSILRV